MHALWQAIKTARAAAYFKSALDNNSTDKMKKQRKNSNSISSKVMLSGIIFAATLALSGRMAYNAFKKVRNKRRFKREQKEKEDAKKNKGKNILKPNKIPATPSYNSSPNYNNTSTSDTLPTSSDRLRQSSVMTKERPQDENSGDNADSKNYKVNPFKDDNYVNNWQEQQLKELQLFTPDYNDSYPGTVSLIPNDKSYHKLYFNDTGIWSLDQDNNKHLLLQNKNSNNDMVNLSILSTGYNSNYLDDICQLYKILSLK